MKFATIEVGGVKRVSALGNDGKLRLIDAAHGSLLQIISDTVDGNFSSIKFEKASSVTSARYLAPIPHPRRNIFCVGKNYHDHAKEFAGSGFDSSKVNGEIPKAPIIFSKVPESVIATNESIQIDPRATSMVDYEGELAVIIGKSGRRIPMEKAYDHVWGYTIINDVTARDVQKRLSQWHVGKSFDTFCPMGPYAVSKSEVDVSNTSLKTWVNGDLRQSANTRDLIFDVPTILAEISAGITLWSGDIIATGTPAGVGIGFDPPRFLNHGDNVSIEIENIGTLQNTVAIAEL